MLGPDESSIAGVASPQNYILHEDTTDKFLMSQPLRIESNVPVTVQRYDDINYVIGTGPIREGEGVVLVTSNCNTGATDVVPTVEIATDGNATVVSVKLGVPKGGASEMPFLQSSSYEAVFYENRYVQFNAADIQPEGPIVEYVGTCTTQDQCDKKRLELGIETFVPGTFSTKGCFSKTGVNGLVAYWSEGGTADEISSTNLPGVQERIACEGDGSTSAGGTECEIGPMADPAKSCESGQFCQLDVGVCNTKSGVFAGVCTTKPEACIEIYDPVRELEWTSRKKSR